MRSCRELRVFDDTKVCMEAINVSLTVTAEMGPLEALRVEDPWCGGGSGKFQATLS